MMKDIAIFGAGGMGRETACLVDRLNKNGESWNFVGFFDDGLPIGQPVSHYGKVLGGIDALNAWPREIALSIALGNPDLIYKIKNAITNPRVSFPNLIDTSFEIVDPETFSIGEGNIIQQHCMASCGTSIGNFNLLKVGDRISFDRVGAYTMCFTPLFIRYWPAVYVEHEGKISLVRKRWRASDYMANSIL